MVRLFIHRLEQEFARNADTAKSNEMSRYMRGQFPFYGIHAPQRRKLFRKVLEETGLPPKESLPEIVTICWEKKQREFQHTGMELAGKYLKQVDRKDISLYEMMITGKSWWDTVDYIAATLVGNWCRGFPEESAGKVRAWLHSDNLWLQRTTLIFQLKYKKNTDVELLSETVRTLNRGNEFFIHKAIGWALRQYSKTDPEWIKSFVELNSLSPLSHREALKWLNRKKSISWT